MAKAVPVAGRPRTMIGSPVALYADRKPAGFRWVYDAEVDAEAGHADLRHYLIPVAANDGRDHFLEWAVAIVTGSVAGGDMTGLGEMQEFAQHTRAARRCVWRNVGGGDR